MIEIAQLERRQFCKKDLYYARADVGTFNTADAEQTDEDKEIFVNQQKKIAAFNAYVKNNAIASVGISKAEPTAQEEAAPPPPLELPQIEGEQEMEVTYHVSDPLADL